ncbi:hypothetical protein AURDEDRAFT_127093 [Auricularia subglabra TFB-10046 SS5]|uniref:Uncharacterized protein n=1 Tax=Auricularia subglabra (strain TFB-10046 / SS5) TaxID=717982 RepID=J0WX76_AURST|nr:hypothetical protein AURDEDRAFT_127093 [Auricularia subglabra TFB-10046 SS5]
MSASIEPTSQDVIVEDNDSAIQYGPLDKWSESRDTNIIEFGTTYHLTGALGAWAAFSFSGTRIWYYADRLDNHGNFGASIDGGPSAVYSSFNTALLKGQLLFYAQVPPGRHTLNITNLEDTKVVGLDRFVYVWIAAVFSIPSALTCTAQISPTRHRRVCLLPHLLLSAQTSSHLRDPISSTTSGASPGATPDQQQGGDQTSSSSHSALSAGAYVGIGLAAGAIALLLVLVVAFLWTRRRRQPPPPQWDAGPINAAHAARPWQGPDPPSRQWSQFSASRQQAQTQQGTELPAYDASSHSRSGA